jgi:hypothetical protein
MKLPKVKIIFALALAAGDAFAQSNKIPGDTDYAAFSRFVAERNIFDPNRVPHYTSTRTRTTRTTRTHSASAPAFTFVGTMAYEKGLFAFFSGNNDDLKQSVVVSGKIADFTVTEISRGRAVLQSADKKETLELKVGDVMRQENGKWELSDSGEMPAGSAPAAAAATGAPGADSASVPVPTGPASDILKRLMEQRAKENQ